VDPREMSISQLRSSDDRCHTNLPKEPLLPAVRLYTRFNLTGKKFLAYCGTVSTDLRRIGEN
jgi:hypothetical protein